MKRTTQRLVWTVAFIIWLCVIWGHSLMPADVSSAESSRFVFLVRPIFGLFGCEDEDLMTFFIRKCAHFSEYVVMAILAARAACAWFETRRAALLAALVVWAAVPCVDETIQLFVPGRDGRFTDVLIDMSGGLLGLCLAGLIRLPPRASRP